MFCMHNGVFCIPEHPTNIYISYMYNAKAYSAASATLASTKITTTAMMHIAIQEQLDGKVVEWMEKVIDEQYQR